MTAMVLRQYKLAIPASSRLLPGRAWLLTSEPGPPVLRAPLAARRAAAGRRRLSGVVAELDQVGDHVFTGFGAVVLILATLNLVDFYIVRRGHYAIAEIVNPRGLYGRWGWRGVLAYLIGFAAMSPFFSVGTLYEGAAAKALDGADISFFIGLPVAGILLGAAERPRRLTDRSGPTSSDRAAPVRRLRCRRELAFRAAGHGPVGWRRGPARSMPR